MNIEVKVNDYVKKVISPDRKYYLLLQDIEMRMSHWVSNASLFEEGAETAIAEIGGDMWSVDQVSWSADGKRVAMQLRRYPGDVDSVDAVIDLERGVVELKSIDGEKNLSLSALNSWLELFYQRHSRYR